MLRLTRRGLETWHGRDVVTLANERASKRGIQNSTYTNAPVLDPTTDEKKCIKDIVLLWVSESNHVYSKPQGIDNHTENLFDLVIIKKFL